MIIPNIVKENDVNNLKNQMKIQDISGTYARNALIASKRLVYQEPYKNPEGYNLKSKVATPSTDSFTLYPNPAKESFTLTNDLLYKNLSIILFSSMGEKVFTSIFDQQVQEFKPDLKSGVYIINIYEKDTMLRSFKLTIVK